MSWLHNFLSNFHHTEDQVGDVVKNLIQHVENEFTALEARVKAVESAPVPMPESAPIA